MEDKDLEELKAHISVIEELIEKHRAEGDPYLRPLQVAFMYMDSERIKMEKLAQVDEELNEQECSIEGAISVLLSLKDRIRNYEHMFPLLPKDYLDKLADAERKGLNKAISVLKAVASITESSEWFESIRWRIVEYDKNMPYYPEDYKEQLIKVDTAAIDSFISVLKSLE